MFKKKTQKLVVAMFLLVTIATLGLLIYRKQSEPELKLEGWINCMPAPDTEGSVQDKLCRQAEKQNYPYIAY